MFTPLVYGKILLWLMIIIFMIIIMAYIFTKIEKSKLFLFNNKLAGRVEILETKHIDFKQKIITFKQAGNYYLLLLSPNGNLLIDKFNEENVT